MQIPKKNRMNLWRKAWDCALFAVCCEMVGPRRKSAENARSASRASQVNPQLFELHDSVNTFSIAVRFTVTTVPSRSIHGADLLLHGDCELWNHKAPRTVRKSFVVKSLCLLPFSL
ncbi:hypothetical protein ACMFMG_001222 [Clarireedia jacksonii]